MDLIECERCGREWDGFAQCNCFYNYSSDGDNDYLDLDIDYISEIVPFWDLIYTLKAFQSD